MSRWIGGWTGKVLNFCNVENMFLIYVDGKFFRVCIIFKMMLLKYDIEFFFFIGIR